MTPGKFGGGSAREAGSDAAAGGHVLQTPGKFTANPPPEAAAAVDRPPCAAGAVAAAAAPPAAPGGDVAVLADGGAAAVPDGARDAELERAWARCRALEAQLARVNAHLGPKAAVASCQRAPITLTCRLRNS